MKTKMLLIMCLVVLVGCKKTVPVNEIPVVKFEYQEVKNLIEFRKTDEFKKISGVLMQFGYNSKHPQVIFAVGPKKLIDQLGLVGYNGDPIDDRELMGQLVNFKVKDEAVSLAYGASFVYIVVNDNGEAVGHVVPFDKNAGVYYGNDWSSDQLGAVFENVKKKGINWEE
jgi:hypothetical protein